MASYVNAAMRPTILPVVLSLTSACGGAAGALPAEAGPAAGPAPAHVQPTADVAPGVAPMVPPAAEGGPFVSFPEGEAWVPAWVTRCGDTIAVVHRDGAVEEVPRAEVRSIELAPGQRLTAFFRGGARSFPARVLERASGRIHVGYDDGDQEWILPEQIESVRNTAGATAPGRASLGTACRGADAIGRWPIALVRRFEVRVPARVVECAPGGAAVLRDAEGRITVRAAGVLADVELAPRDRVDARWQGRGRFPATVESVDGSAAALVYDDGDRGPVTPADVLVHFVPIRDRARPAPALLCTTGEPA